MFEIDPKKLRKLLHFDGTPITARFITQASRRADPEVERLLAGSGRFNVGLAAVMTMQGVGASLSNVVAGAVAGAAVARVSGAGGGMSCWRVTIWVIADLKRLKTTVATSNSPASKAAMKAAALSATGCRRWRCFC